MSCKFQRSQFLGVKSTINLKLGDQTKAISSWRYALSNYYRFGHYPQHFLTAIRSGNISVPHNSHAAKWNNINHIFFLRFFLSVCFHSLLDEIKAKTVKKPRMISMEENF